MKYRYNSKKNTMRTKLSGIGLLNDPILNKGTAFTLEERQSFHLQGLLPPHCDSIEEQVARCYEAFQQAGEPLRQHIYLRALQDCNETLFYRLIVERITELLPIIYTPVVGQACELFSHIYRRPRGLFIAYPHRGKIAKVLENAPVDDVKVIVVTDGERILGLGDQGAGGMGIPIGKLSLYTACAGIAPMNTLPILLDVGTNNSERRHDPSYIGWRHERISGDEYFAFVDEFVHGVIKKFPHALLQFEDFAQTHAFPLLEKYRDKLCTFNDDIQGTAAICAGTLLSAVKSLGEQIAQHRIAVFGAGSAGCGISEQILQLMIHQGKLSEKEARSRFYLLDRQGLLLEDMPGLLPFQKKLAQPRARVATWKLQQANFIGLADIVNNAQPTILLGVSGQPNQFTQSIVAAMQQYVTHPIIFPLSNPTSRAEASPADLIEWTQGRALIATGSPYDQVKYNAKSYVIAQCNNCYIFPGMGLGVLASGARRVSDKMFTQAALALSEASPALITPAGSLLPSLENIRQLSQSIAFAVAKQAMKDGQAKRISDDALNEKIKQTMWFPDYCALKPN